MDKTELIKNLENLFIMKWVLTEVEAQVLWKATLH